jgi:hypothetical protein
MRVVEPLVVEGVEVLGCEVDEDHRRGTCRDSCGTEPSDELTVDVISKQPSSLSRGQYKLGKKLRHRLL